MRLRNLVVLALALAAVLTAPRSAVALTIGPHLELYDPADDTFYFSLTLSGVPVLDAETHDSFQYWISWDLHPGDPLYPFIHADVIVRGGEITGGQIPIRDATGDGGPNSGGWGPIRGMVPYTLTGSTITFAVPRALLGDPDGSVSYFVGVLFAGGFTDTRTGNSTTGSVPTVRTTWGRVKALYR
jgi:hypothetical protein